MTTHRQETSNSNSDSDNFGSLPSYDSDFFQTFESPTLSSESSPSESCGSENHHSTTSDTEDQPNISGRKFVYTCCGRSITGYNSHRIHKIEHHSRSITIGERTIQRSADGKFTCPGCGASFSTASNFRKNHSGCLEHATDQTNNDQGTFESFLERHHLYIPPTGQCIICKDHEKILGKKKQQCH